jgi:hypothetical protein
MNFRESLIVVMAIVIIGTIVTQTWMLAADTPFITVMEKTPAVATSLAITGILVSGFLQFAK